MCQYECQFESGSSFLYSCIAPEFRKLHLHGMIALMIIWKGAEWQHHRAEKLLYSRPEQSWGWWWDACCGASFGRILSDVQTRHQFSRDTFVKQGGLAWPSRKPAEGDHISFPTTYRWVCAADQRSGTADRATTCFCNDLRPIKGFLDENVSWDREQAC